MKVATGGAINAPAQSMATAVQLRGQAILKLLPFVVMGPILNYLRWGQAFPQGIPAFAIKTREDEAGEEGKTKSHYFDQLKFTGLRRGWRATGQNALIERAVNGGDRNLTDQVGSDLIHSGEHLVAGPPVQAVHTLLTGEDALGRKVAQKPSTAKTSRGITAAEKKGLPAPGSSELKERAKAALQGINPVVATLSGPQASGKTLLENLMQSAGPFGESTRVTKGPAKSTHHK